MPFEDLINLIYYFQENGIFAVIIPFKERRKFLVAIIRKLYPLKSLSKGTQLLK
jgi:hypothetical protein